MDTEYVAGNDILEETDETKSAKERLAGVSYGLARSTGQLIGGSYRVVSRFSKVMKHCGERITGAGHEASAEDDPCVQLAEPDDEVADDNEAGDFKSSAALHPGQEETTSGKRATKALLAALESNLGAVRCELDKTRSQAKETQNRLTSQLKALKKEKKSLVSDLERAKSQAKKKTVKKDVINERVAALESELIAAKEKMDQIQNKANQTQVKFKSQLKTLQEKNKSLADNLQKARSEVDEARAKEGKLSTQVSILESELATVRCQLYEALRKAGDTESDLSPSVDVVETEPDSIIAETKHAKTTATLVEKKITNAVVDAVTQPAEEEKAGTKKQEPEAQVVNEAVEAKSPVSDDVTVEEVNAAVFDREAEKIIFTKALHDITGQDKATRIDAVKAIGDIRHELSTRVLVAQVASEPAPQVRSECIKALAALNMKEGLAAVENALMDEASLVRLAAVWSLYRMAGVESAPALIQMCADEDEEVRRRAVTCIGWLGKEELATALVPLLNDSSISVQQAAIKAMVNLHSRAVVSALIEHLHDSDRIIRKDIITALKIITGRKMNGRFPKDKESLKQCIIQWRRWWDEQYPE